MIPSGTRPSASPTSHLREKVNKAVDPIRHISIEDLIILKGLAEGRRVNEIAYELHITQPAVSTRMKKLSALFDDPLFARAGRVVELTEAGIGLAERASLALDLLRGPKAQMQSPRNPRLALTIGTRPEAGLSWLGPVLLSLRERDHEVCYHIRFGSGAQLLKDLQNSDIDAVLTSAPLMTGDYDALEVAREDYIFVGTPELCSGITDFSDLREAILIEHDRSFPFLNYLSPEIRAKLKFKDVWFVGSTRMMVSAIKRGLGVGIIPEYLVRKDLSEGQLSPVNLKMNEMYDHFRIIHHRRAGLRTALVPVADALIHFGLTDGAAN